MSETVLIVLIIAVALVLVLFIFRRQLSDFRFRGGKQGVDMQLKTRRDASRLAAPRPENASGTSVSRNRIKGWKNKVDIQLPPGTSVDENEMSGTDLEIRVRPVSKKK